VKELVELELNVGCGISRFPEVFSSSKDGKDHGESLAVHDESRVGHGESRAGHGEITFFLYDEVEEWD